MGNCGTLPGKKDRENSERTRNKALSDKNPTPPQQIASALPPIKYAQKKMGYDGRGKSIKISNSIKPSNSSELMELTASTNAEDGKSTSERQSYKRENKQQGQKVMEGISNNFQSRNAAPKTSFLEVQAGKDFHDEKKKRESDTAKWDVRDTPIESKIDSKDHKERPRTTSSVYLEERASHERIVSEKLGISNDQGKDILTVRNDNEDNTSRSAKSTRDEPIKDPGPSHSRNEADEENKGNRSLNTEPCTNDLYKKSTTKGHNKRKIKELEVHVRQLIEEKNALLNRLSEIGAMKLIDNNPNITDLSDTNRPEKLVEQLSELYDNEWTNAYEHLTKTHFKPNDQSVKLLLQALKEVYNICLSSTNKKAKKLREAMLSYVGLSDEESTEIELQEIEKKIYEYRTKKSTSNVSRVGKEVWKRLRDQFKLFETETLNGLSLYIDGCVRICWYMCIKNPPMHLDFGEKEKTTTADNSKTVLTYFDKTKFTSFTKQGDYIEYVVWPAVFLHYGGSIMRKGVAQGTPVITNMLLDVTDGN